MHVLAWLSPFSKACFSGSLRCVPRGRSYRDGSTSWHQNQNHRFNLKGLTQSAKPDRRLKTLIVSLAGPLTNLTLLLLWPLSPKLVLQPLLCVLQHSSY